MKHFLARFDSLVSGVLSGGDPVRRTGLCFAARFSR